MIVSRIASRKRKKIITKSFFIIRLFDKISKNPSLIIYADLKITTLDRRDGCLNS
jgi:hypothetical protein